MPVSQQELGHRIKQARLGRALTQDAISKVLQISRSAVAQIEGGSRAVSSFELDKLAAFFGKSMSDFLADNFQEYDPLTALFRADLSKVESDAFIQVLRKALNIAREVSNLEQMLEIRMTNHANIIYPCPAPRNKWEAIQQGCHLADAERRRLNLGSVPIHQIHQLLESVGIKVDLLPLPDDVSGITLYDASIGPFIVVNAAHSLYRRHFSYAHEYAHVLVDRNGTGVISPIHTDEKSLVEIRANAFAASFLLPEEGVRSYIANFGKGESGRLFTDSQDELIEGRSSRGNQAIQIYDVALLAHYFGVSRQAAINRLRSLKLISEPEFAYLKQLEIQGIGRQAALLLSLTEMKIDNPGQELHNRLISLGLEAYRRDLITFKKLKELSVLSSMPTKYLESLVREIEHDKNSGFADILLPD